MKILAFDTCLDKTYITLAEDDKILKSETIVSNGQNYHSAYLISTIVKILKETDLTPKNIDLIAKSFNIKVELLFNEETAKLAKKLPARVDMYKR